MQEVEDKTGIIKRFLSRSAHVDAITAAAGVRLSSTSLPTARSVTEATKSLTTL